jgi:outer membrane protein
MIAAALGAGTAAQAQESRAGEWMIRGRVLSVQPDESSTISAIGGTAHADNSVVPEVDITYFITNNLAAELIAAVTKHDVEARGTTLGRVDLGDAWLLPPTLTLQYHISPQGGVDPYVGVGLNYTTFFDVDKGPAPITSIHYGDSFGVAAQAGIDVRLNERWVFNADVKKVWLNTKVRINNGAINADVDLDPWIAGVGFGYRF